MNYKLLFLIMYINISLAGTPPDRPDVPEDVSQEVHKAITDHDTELIRLRVIQNGYNINDMWQNGRLPIHTAWQQLLENYGYVIQNIRHAEDACNNTKDILRLLVALGAHTHALNAQEKNVFTIPFPLPISQNGTVKQQLHFFRKQLSYQEEAQEALGDAIAEGNERVVRDALEHHRIRYKCEDDRTFDIAIPDICDIRSSHENWSLVHLAVWYEQKDILYLLLSDPDIRTQIYSRDIWGNRPLNLIVNKFTSSPGKCLDDDENKQYPEGIYTSLTRAIIHCLPPQHRNRNHKSRFLKIKKQVEQIRDDYDLKKYPHLKRYPHACTLYKACTTFLRIYEFGEYNPDIIRTYHTPLRIRTLPDYDEIHEAATIDDNFSAEDIDEAIQRLATTGYHDTDNESNISDYEDELASENESTNYGLSLSALAYTELGGQAIDTPHETRVRRRVRSNRADNVAVISQSQLQNLRNRLYLPTPGRVAYTFNPQLSPRHRHRNNIRARDNLARLMRRYVDQSESESENE